jgi:hypothetical protein
MFDFLAHKFQDLITGLTGGNHPSAPAPTAKTVSTAPGHTAAPAQTVSQPQQQSPFSFQGFNLQPPAPAPVTPPHPNTPLDVIGSAVHNVGNFVNNNVVQPALQDASKVANTVGLPIAATTAAITGQANNPQVQQHLNQMLQNSFVPRNVAAGTASPAEFGQDITKTGIHLAPYAVGGPESKLLDDFGATVGSKVGDGLAGTIANKAAQAGAQAAVAAPTFAALNAGDQVLNTGKFDPSQALQSGLQAGGMALGGSLVGDALHGGVSAAAHASSKLLSDDTVIPRSRLLESGSVQLPSGTPKQPSNIPDDFKALVPIAQSAKNADDFETKLAVLNSRSDTDPNVAKAINQLPGKDSVNDLYNKVNPEPVDNMESAGQIAARRVQQQAPQLLPEIPEELKPLAVMAERYPDKAKFSATFTRMKEMAAEHGDQDQVNKLNKYESLVQGKLDSFHDWATQAKQLKDWARNQRTDAAEQQLKQQKLSGKQRNIGKTLNLSDDDMRKALADAEAKRSQNQILPDAKYNGRLNLEDNPHYNEYNKLFAAPSQTINDALLKSQAGQDILADKAAHVFNKSRGLDEADKSLLRKAETTSDKDILKEAHKPEDVGKTLKAIRDYYDARHAIANIAGQSTPYIKNYFRHQYDLGSPDAVKAMERFQTYLLKHPSFTKGRKLDSYATAAKFGLNPRFNDALHDVLHDYTSSTPSIRANILARELDQMYPGQVAVGELPQDQSGGVYKQVQVFGNQGSKIAVPKEIAAEINKHAFPEQSPATTKMETAAQGALKGYDVVNRAAKQTLLGGGLFHLGNTGMYALTKPVALLKYVTNGKIDDALETPLQASRQKLAGLTTGADKLGADFKSGKSDDYDKAINDALKEPSDAKKVLNAGKGVINVTHHLTFDTGITNFKKAIFNSVTKDLDFSKADDLAEGRHVAEVVNNFFGGINRLMSGSWSPRVFKSLSRVLLAPDFLEGQMRGTAQGFIGAAKIIGGTAKADKADKLAAQMLFGRIIGVSAAVTAVNALTNPNKENQDPVSLFKRFLGNMLDPEVETGLKSQRYKGDPDGTPQSVGLPNTFVNVLAKMAEPLFNGDPNKFSGVEHEVDARTAAGLRGVTSLATNQDYYGNPIIVPGDAKRTAFNVASQFGPIPVASAISSTKSGNQPINFANVAISAAGGRLHNDPNSPKTQQANQYYSTLDQAHQGLNAKETAALDLATASSKDPQTGQYIVQPSVFDSKSKATALLDQPNALNALITMNQKLKSEGQQVDPLYNQSKSTITKVLQYQSMDLGSSQKDKWMLQNSSWYQPLSDARTAYFNSLPPADPNKPQLPIQPPTASPQLQGLLNQYDGITDSQTKAQFMTAHPDIGQFFDNMSAYTNKMLVAQGEDPLRTYPQAGPSTQQFMDKYFATSTSGRSALRTADPQNYLAMENYMANNDRYQLDKQAGLDQLLGPGQNNLTAPGQAFQKAAFGLGQYDIAKGTAPDGSTAFQWFPSTNGAPGSTANISPLSAITQGGIGFTGVKGYSSKKKSYSKTTGPRMKPSNNHGASAYKAYKISHSSKQAPKDAFTNALENAIKKGATHKLKAPQKAAGKKVKA